MKFPKLSPEGYDLLVDAVLGGLPQGYTFTRDSSGARVRYVVAYGEETLLQITVGKSEIGEGNFYGERSLIIERVADRHPLSEATPEEKLLLGKAGDVIRALKDRLDSVAFFMPMIEAQPHGPRLVEILEVNTEAHGNGTPYQVALWLAHYTQEAILHPLKREDGGYFILEPLPYPQTQFTDGQWLEMSGRYHPPDGGAGIETPWIIRFELGIPGTATMRVVARCREAAAHRYFQKLISDFRRAWKCQPRDVNLWFREAVQDLTQPDEFVELLFKGTPYDFGGAVSDFIQQYYSDATAWTGCTFTLQQAEVHPEMPNCAVEIECPADDDGAPAFVWVTARRLPGGKSKLVMTTESGDCGRSSQLRKALDGFLDALTRWGWIAPEGEPTAEKTVSPPPTVDASVIAEKVLQLELDAVENAKRYHAQEKARVLLRQTEDPALRARLEAILEMTVRIIPPQVDRPGAVTLPNPFPASTGDGAAIAAQPALPGDVSRIGTLVKRIELETDIKTFEGALALLHLFNPGDREEHGSLVRWELIYRNAWELDIDMPFGFVEARPIGSGKIEARFFTTKEGDKSADRTTPPEEDEWMNWIIEKVLEDLRPEDQARQGSLAERSTQAGAAIEGQPSPPVEEVTQGGEGDGETIKESDLFKGRQMKVLKLLCDGLYNPDIAERLQIAEGTVKNYVSALYERFKVPPSSGSLARRELLCQSAKEQGLLD